VVAAGGPQTRRALLGAGVAGALVAAGCGDRDPKPAAGGDAGVLAGLLAVERELVTAWGAVAEIGAGKGDTARAVLAHERAHERRLEAELRAAGGATVPAASAAVRDAAAGVRRLAAGGDGTGALQAALLLERQAAGAYLEALPAVRDPARRALVMEIGAIEAEHGSVVLAALGREPLPDAFAGTLRG
jgi:rubrerythrin